MRALNLSTRFREGFFEGSACLLVYDELEISAATISSDVRDLLDTRPNTSWIYIMAPYLAESIVLNAALNDQVKGRAGDQVWVLSFRDKDAHSSKVVRLGHNGNNQVEEDLPSDLQHGWLFNLFDASRGKVTAPPGVHFGKASGKHSTAFLRASNTVLSTKASGLLAFFLLAALPKGDIRRILVDTAPLLSVAQALQRVAGTYKLWSQNPPSSSFSSYGGLDALSRLHRHDLVIISASTSGGLAEKLVDLGASKNLVVTLFSLVEVVKQNAGPVVCDLTFKHGRTFGYLPIDNQHHGVCKWCAQGYLLAPLEGDQFLLEKRPVKRLRISKSDQSDGARALLEKWTRHGYFKLDPFGGIAPKSQFFFDANLAIEEDRELRAKLIRQLRRYAPTPLHVVVLVGLTQFTYQRLIDEAGLASIFAEAEIVDVGQVSAMQTRSNLGILVLIGSLSDHALIRGINAQLRTRASHGCVTYLAAFTFADSKKNLTDLEMFLTYGENGKETFTFKSAENLLLPWRTTERNSWDDERTLLQQIKSESELVPELEARLNSLESAGTLDHTLFLTGKDGNSLAIAPDFVYLDTEVDREKLSQADIFLVITNLLAVARSNGLLYGLPQTHHTWAQSVYGQVLVDLPTVCPRNLRDYNDAILRACFIRAASKQELNYAVDEECSGEVLDVLLAELAAWSDNRGDSLPEILMALATRRLQLTSSDEERLISKLNSTELPRHLAQLRDSWVNSRS